MNEYPRYITKGFRNFDPLALATETEKITCNGNLRKYTGFYVGQEYGGIVTALASGCCLRCCYCWADKSRDFPEKYGRFYSPHEVFSKLEEIANREGINTLRLSGAEPTLCSQHLLEFLTCIEDSKFDFILETNGVTLADESYVEQISKFKKPRIRLCLKAGTPADFARKTGAIPERFELPFKAISNLIKHKVNFWIAVTSDPRIMNIKEWKALIEKLHLIDPAITQNLDEETLLPSEQSLERLYRAGYPTWEFNFSRSAKVFRRIPNREVRQVVKRAFYFLLHIRSQKKQ
jgi:uncharacterized Fe-S cluster-containing radical SAM superfamily protein